MIPYLYSLDSPIDRHIWQIQSHAPPHRDKNRRRERERTGIRHKHGMIIISNLSASLNNRENATCNGKCSDQSKYDT